MNSLSKHFGHHRYPHHHHIVVLASPEYFLCCINFTTTPPSLEHWDRILVLPYLRGCRDHPQTTRCLCWCNKKLSQITLPELSGFSSYQWHLNSMTSLCIVYKNQTTLISCWRQNYLLFFPQDKISIVLSAQFVVSFRWTSFMWQLEYILSLTGPHAISSIFFVKQAICRFSNVSSSKIQIPLYI